MKKAPFLMVLAFGVAQASQWQSYGVSGDGMFETLVDTSSIQVEGNIRHAWVKAIFKPHTKRGVDSYANEWVREDVMREAFNCAEGIYIPETLTITFEDGNVETVPAAMVSLSWQPVRPDTMLYTTLKAVCAWGADSAEHSDLASNDDPVVNATPHTAKWVSLGKTVDRMTELQIDVASITVEGPIRRAWVKLIYAPHGKRVVSESSGAAEWAHYMVGLDAIDCGKELHRFESIHMYWEDGTNNSTSGTLNSAWDPVAPDTITNGEMQFICAWRK